MASMHLTDHHIWLQARLLVLRERLPYVTAMETPDKIALALKPRRDQRSLMGHWAWCS
jgi:hypothetical protein